MVGGTIAIREEMAADYTEDGSANLSFRVGRAGDVVPQEATFGGPFALNGSEGVCLVWGPLQT